MYFKKFRGTLRNLSRHSFFFFLLNLLIFINTQNKRKINDCLDLVQLIIDVCKVQFNSICTFRVQYSN